MALSFETVKEFIKKSQLLKEEARKNGEAYFKALLQNLFEENPEIQMITWTQGTPGFNDGEPCTFNLHEIDYILTPEYLESINNILLAEPKFKDSLLHLYKNHESGFIDFKYIVRPHNSILEFIDGQYDLKSKEEYGDYEYREFIDPLCFLKRLYDFNIKDADAYLNGEKIWVFPPSGLGIRRSLTLEEMLEFKEQLNSFKLVQNILQKNDYIFKPIKNIEAFSSSIQQTEFKEILNSLFGNAKITVKMKSANIIIEENYYNCDY